MWEALHDRGLREERFSSCLARQPEVVLVVERQDVSETVAAEVFAASWSTVSRVRGRVEPVVREVLAGAGTTSQEAGAGRVLVVDGALVPTGGRPGRGEEVEKEGCSGRHRAQGVGVQVAALADGSLVAVSDTVRGRRHDPAASETVGWEEVMESTDWIADTACVGTDAVAPRKRPRGGVRSEAGRILSRSVSSTRSAAGHPVRHLKEQKTVATGRRRRLSHLPDAIKTVTRLELYRETHA